ncbi:MAG: aldo/keto reductase [Myxococcales bacterium]|nr:aldo/keto reductase [Myxococcales bacterium]
MALSRGAEVLCLPYNLFVQRLVDDLTMELAHATVEAAAKPPAPAAPIDPIGATVLGAPAVTAASSPAASSAADAPSVAARSSDTALHLDSGSGADSDSGSDPGSAGPTTGAGLLVRSPLLHGLLTGRWTEYRQFADDDHRRSRWTTKALTLRVRQVNQLRFLVDGDVRSLTSAALRFVLANPRVGCAFLGARRPVQISPAPGLAGDPPYLDPTALAKVADLVADFY